MLSSTPVEQGYRDFSYGNGVYHRPTAEKPQSKLWWNDGVWWGCLWDASQSAYRIHRLDTSTQCWSSVGPNAGDDGSAIVDVKWDGTNAYILAHPFEANGNFTLHSYSYDATTQSYALRAGFPVTPTSGDAEAATLDKDSTGKLWITWEEGGDIMLVTSQGNDTTWGTPFVLPVQGGSASSDDISSVAAFDGKIGVMWSNQSDERVYFALHLDGDPDTTWQPREDALGGPGEGPVADDHLNFALTCDAGANVYAVVKTSIGLPGEPRVMLAHRDPSGTWSDYVVGRDEDDHTRPIVVIDEENRQIYVFAKSDTGDNSIRMKTSDLDNISFTTGPGQMFIQSSTENDVNNPTSTKQTLNGNMDLLVLASDGSARVYMHNFIDLPGGGPTTEPDIAISPASLDYGDVDVGTQATQTLRVHNVGDATLNVSTSTLTGADSAEYAVVAGAAPFSVAPGDSHDVDVRFAPGAPGATTATLELASDDPDESLVGVVLSGNGVAVPGPDVDVTPASHDYGPVLVGATATQTFWIRNTGTASLNVSAVDLIGSNAAHYSLAIVESSFALAVGDSEQVDVTFTPTSLGARSATLRVTSDDPNENPFDVPLSGEGAAPTAAAIAVEPALVDWGDVLLGSTVSRVLDVRNEGTASLDVSATAIAGSDAGLFTITSGAAPFSVVPGDTHQIVLEFSPTSAGAKLATLEIASNDPDEALLQVLLRGDGTNVVSTGGDVTLQEIVTGGAVSALAVATSGSPAAVAHDVYLAAIATKNLENVVAVDGMGMNWSLVSKQCGARGQTGVEVWMARSASPSSGPVTATFDATANAAVIAVSRYTGVHATSPFGAAVTASTHGISGACDGTGVDTSAYSVPLTTTADNGVVFAAIAKRHKDHVPDADWRERVVAEAGSGGSIAGVVVVDSTVSPPGAVTLSGTFDSPVDWAVVAFELIPEPGETSSDVRPQPALPEDVVLRVVPGSSAPRIELWSAEPTRLRLTVHDVRGRLVSTLWNGAHPAGPAVFEWQPGIGAAGVYFVRAQMWDRVLTSKLLRVP